MSISFCSFSQLLPLSPTSMTPSGPRHLLNPTRFRLYGDTIIYNFQGDPFQPLPEVHYTIIDRSEDGLTDTIHYAAGLLRDDINQYNDKKQIISCIVGYPFRYYMLEIYENCCGEYSKEEYEYDEEGRITKFTLKWLNSPTNVVREEVTNYDYSTFEYTAKGYIYDGIEYELDDEKKVTLWKNLNNPGEYGEFDGKQYHLGDYHYEYFEGGVSVIGYDYYEYNYLYIGPHITKRVYVYKPDLMTETMYRSLDGKTWELISNNERSVLYKSNVESGGNPNGNWLTETDVVKVYGSDNAVMISSPESVRIAVYDITGRLLRQHQTEGGGVVSRLPVPKGLYIVKAGNEVKKVVVR